MESHVPSQVLEVEDVDGVELALADGRHQLDLAEDGGRVQQGPTLGPELRVRVKADPGAEII